MIVLNNNDKKRIRAIRHAESEALFNSIGDGAMSTNEKGEITRINDEALRILYYTKADDVLGRNISDIFDLIDENGNIIQESSNVLSRVLKDLETISSERIQIKKKRQNDPLMHLEITASPMKLKNQVLGTIILFRDVTEEHKIDQMKDDFISLASHQLRTPISAISTYSHMLVDGYMGELTEEQKNFIKTIIKSSNRMNGVISSLTSISKLDSGAVKFSPRKTNINQILDGVFHENRIEIEERQISYKNISDKDSPCIIVNDSILITEVINNIASNAIKYNQRGGTVTAKATKTVMGVTVEIVDSGIGISEKDQEKIFEKFFRAPGITKYETFGSGLGLYIVKGFLDIIGGSVRFRSIKGQGTTFEITIPDMSNMKMNV